MHMRSLTVQVLLSRSAEEYDPLRCKTCQKIGRRRPKKARVRYSDCEEHFQERVGRLWSTGVTMMNGKGSAPRVLPTMKQTL